MSGVVTADSTILFEPGPAWSWDGWNGEIKLSVVSQGVKAEGNDVAVEKDLVALGQKLMGKKYKASGFDNVPGVVSAATVSVTGASLSNVQLVGGMKVAHVKTTGTFMLTCVPSVNTSPSAPIPDPCPVKTGTWKVKESSQSVAEST